MSVEDGAKLLDSVDPDWYKKVKITTLDMSNGNVCVLGQLYDDYYEGLLKIIPHKGSSTESSVDRFATKYGFQLESADDPAYPELTGQWKEEIRKRRSNAHS